MLFKLWNCTRVQISGWEAENKWTSWKYWEWGRYSTAKSSRTATGMQFVICLFGGIYETSKIHKLCLRVRAREVQSVQVIIMSWTWTSIVVTIKVITGFPGDFWKSQPVFPGLRKWMSDPLQNNPQISFSPKFFWVAQFFCNWCHLLQPEKNAIILVSFICALWLSFCIDHQMLFYWLLTEECRRFYSKEIFPKNLHK